MRYIGTTLFFSQKEGKMYKAIQSSFIFERKSFSDLRKEINYLSSELVKTDFKGYNFLGISDLYITENEGEANFLGRTSFFDDKKIEDAKKYILNESELKEAYEGIKLYEKSNVGFVYFHKDKEGEEYNSTIIIYSQISKNKTLKDIHNLANSSSFRQKIIDFSVEQLYMSGLKLIGISNLYPIKDKGLFAHYGNFEDLKEIESELIPDEELNDKFNEVLEDYEYIN